MFLNRATQWCYKWTPLYHIKVSKIHSFPRLKIFENAIGNFQDQIAIFKSNNEDAITYKCLMTDVSSVAKQIKSFSR